MTSSVSKSGSARPAVLGLVLSLFWVHSQVQAQDASYLTQMPSTDRVVQDMKVSGSRDTAARTFVALSRLLSIIQSQAGRRRALPAEQRLAEQYSTLAFQIRAQENAKLDPSCNANDCEKYLIARCEQAYTFEPAFSRLILDKYFTPEWQQQFGSNLGGTVWQDALKLPAGTQLSSQFQKAAAKSCGDTSVLSRFFHGSSSDSTAPQAAAYQGNAGPGFFSVVLGALWSLFKAIWIPLLIGYWVLRRFFRSRFWLNRKRRKNIQANNHEALALFVGATQQERERSIIDAFDAPDYTFEYSVIDKEAKNSFVLLRHTRSFKRDEFEALRFAYLVYNRGILSDEQFHWFRCTAIYGGGATDPSEYRRLKKKWFKTDRDDIEEGRQAVAKYMQANSGMDIEGQALAIIQKLTHSSPADPLYRDMKQRFVEGAYWLTPGELKRSAFAPSESRYSLTFGVLDGTSTELVYSGDGSVITVAPPGSGKTQCNVFPNLLRWPGPAVVFDVKGEIYDQTSRWRAQNVGPVIKFSPLDPQNSACFNPLTFVRRDTLYIWEDARFLAQMMIVPVAKEPFWEDKAREILTCIIADVAFWNLPDKRPLSKMLSIINRNGWAEFVDRMQKNPESQTIRDEGANLAHMDPKTLDGALQTAKASLSAWVGERIAQVTRASDWSPLDLRGGKNPTIYICVRPNEIDAYLSLLRVVIAQHIRALTSAEIPPHGAPPILFVLDELPRLKYMPPVEEALEVGRGYGIKLWMFAQSLGQLRNAYPNADGMMGSCGVRTFMNPSLQDGTAALLSEQIGFRSGEHHGGKGQSANVQATPKLIIDAPTLSGADFKDLQIVLGVGSKPARVRKRFAYQDPSITAKMGAVAPAAVTAAGS